MLAGRFMQFIAAIIIGCVCADVAAMQAPVATKKAQAMARFTQEQPRAEFMVRGSRIDRVYGAAFSRGNSPEQSAESFLQQHSMIWGVSADELKPIGPFPDARQSQPLMFDQATGLYRFTAHYYTQWRGDVPVFRSKLVLLVRNEPNFPLVLASSSLRELGDLDVGAARNEAQRSNAARQSVQRAAGNLAQLDAGELVIWAGVDDVIAPPRLAYKFTTQTVGAPVDQFESWLFIADANTGEILHRESRICHVNITGNVSGMVTSGLSSDACAGVEVAGLPYVQVSSQSNSTFADADGNFVLSNAGATSVDVTATMLGQYFQLFNYNGTANLGPATQLQQSVLPPGPVNFMFNQANASEFARAEVNAYLHANIVRDYILSHVPNYPTVDTQTDFAITVNRNLVCNAFYLDNAINFYTAGGGCSNTATSTIVYHEYGHHLVAAAGSGQGSYGEGMSDCVSIVVSDDPCLADGFQTCGVCLRTGENNCQYDAQGCSTCGSTIHSCGTILSGCIWKLRNNLLATKPIDYRAILSSLTLNSILLHSGSSITPSITIDFLTLDDDDADMANGTPHYEQINAAFTAHNMPGPALTLFTFAFPNGTPALIAPSGGTTMRVQLSPLTGTPEPNSAILHVDGGSGSFIEIPMTPISPNVYDAIFPALPCGTQLRYYVSARSTTDVLVTSPMNAPSATYAAVSGESVAVPFVDDFEIDSGWTIVNSPGLVSGNWQRADPSPTCSVRGAPPSDADGSGFCFVTQNAPPPLPPTGNECDLDVDSGATTLTSPIMDATHDVPILSYSRWFTNFVTGNSGFQQDDVFRVEFSINGGKTWNELETVGPISSSPVPVQLNTWVSRSFNMTTMPGFGPTTQFQVRFIAADIGNASTVEAAIDAVVLRGYVCNATCAGDIDLSGAVGVPDLLAVINSWGPCIGCSADIAPPGGDGAVGVPDLLAIINAWGPCEQ